MIKVLIMLTCMLTSITVTAGDFYDFPFNDTVTMDVEKTNGGGGTWKCASVRDCYIKVLEAEARGANQYCESIVIKRNGKVVWTRKYK